MNEKVDMPQGIEPHASDYKPNAWTNYTFEELGQWIALFCKRSSHRSNLKKRAKDLYDARNYLNMMDTQLSHLEDQLYETLFLYDPQLVGEEVDPPGGVEPDKLDLREPRVADGVPDVVPKGMSEAKVEDEK